MVTATKRKHPMKKFHQGNFIGPMTPYPMGVKYLREIVKLAMHHIGGLSGWEYAAHRKSDWEVTREREGKVVLVGRFDSSGAQLPSIKNVVAKMKKKEKEGARLKLARGAQWMLLGTIRAEKNEETGKYRVSSFLRFVHTETGRIAAAASNIEISEAWDETSSSGDTLGETVEKLLREALAQVQNDFKALFSKGGAPVTRRQQNENKKKRRQIMRKSSIENIIKEEILAILQESSPGEGDAAAGDGAADASAADDMPIPGKGHEEAVQTVLDWLETHSGSDASALVGNLIEFIKRTKSPGHGVAPGHGSSMGSVDSALASE